MHHSTLVPRVMTKKKKHLRRVSAVGSKWVSAWVVRVGGDHGELRPCRYMHVYSIESRQIMRVGYDLRPRGICDQEVLGLGTLYGRCLDKVPYKVGAWIRYLIR